MASLIAQTNYAELLERCATAAFAEAFPAGGAFTKKTIKGRPYWYFQSTAHGRRTQKYVGRETPEILARIQRHDELKNDERDRRDIVSALVGAFGLPKPKPEIGDAIEALAKAGAFRLRSVLVGTVAYQTYPAMLGATLPSASLLTNDIDIAQFEDVSIAVADQTLPALDILKSVDASFRPIPTIHESKVTSYQSADGLRVEFLTPNRGPDADIPRRLTALHTDAQPLRFLDFLIHNPEPAVLLHGSGVYVNVPSPHRYAVHKLMISRRRPEGAAKRDKDIHQAEALLVLLARKRAYDLKEIWNEAEQRGPEWRKLLHEGFAQLSPQTKEQLADIAPKAAKQKK